MGYFNHDGCATLVRHFYGEPMPFGGPWYLGLGATNGVVNFRHLESPLHNYFGEEPLEGGGYQRVQLTDMTVYGADQPENTSGVTVYANVAPFPTATSDWVTFRGEKVFSYWLLFDAATVGHIIAHGALERPIIVKAGQTIDVGTIAMCFKGYNSICSLYAKHFAGVQPDPFMSYTSYVGLGYLPDGMRNETEFLEVTGPGYQRVALTPTNCYATEKYKSSVSGGGLAYASARISPRAGYEFVFNATGTWGGGYNNTGQFNKIGIWNQATGGVLISTGSLWGFETPHHIVSVAPGDTIRLANQPDDPLSFDGWGWS